MQEPSSQARHIDVLDGWRATSILAVLAGHWLPLGLKSWGFNHSVPAAGMALFFTLSGFLIVNLLLRDDRATPFLIRRLFRIVPLAWGAMLILAVATQADIATIAANLLFYSNLPPSQLMAGGEHLWSLCVEVQFYVLVAAIVAVAGRGGLYALPLLGFAVTGLRIWDHETISIVTWHRVDEILAGAMLALIVARLPPGGHRSIFAWAPVVASILLLAAAHPEAGPLAYARPYFAALAIGTSLYVGPSLLTSVLTSRPARYIAQISYALYVVHGMLTATVLGGTDASKTEKYLLRPVLIAATFLLAHISTFRYEKHWIALGKRVARSAGGREREATSESAA